MSTGEIFVSLLNFATISTNSIDKYDTQKTQRKPYIKRTVFILTPLLTYTAWVIVIVLKSYF